MTPETFDASKLPEVVALRAALLLAMRALPDYCMEEEDSDEEAAYCAATDAGSWCNLGWTAEQEAEAEQVADCWAENLLNHDGKVLA